MLNEQDLTKQEEIKLQESMEVMESKVKVFNEQWPVGSVVTVVKDFGECVETKIKYPAQLLSGHTAVIWLENISGAYALNRVATHS